MVWLRERERERHGSDLLCVRNPCFRCLLGRFYQAVIHPDSLTSPSFTAALNSVIIAFDIIRVHFKGGSIVI